MLASSATAQHAPSVAVTQSSSLPALATAPCQAEASLSTPTLPLANFLILTAWTRRCLHLQWRRSHPWRDQCPTNTLWKATFKWHPNTVTLMPACTQHTVVVIRFKMAFGVYIFGAFILFVLFDSSLLLLRLLRFSFGATTINLLP